MNQADHFLQDLIPTTKVEVPPVDPVQLVLHSVSLQHEQAQESPEEFSEFLEHTLIPSLASLTLE
jgi:hypothetical protein